jgi:hypothetical protein
LDGQVRGLVAGIDVALVGFFVVTIIAPESWPTFFAAVLVTVVLASPLLWLTGMTAADRSLLRILLGRVRRISAVAIE